MFVVLAGTLFASPAQSHSASEWYQSKWKRSHHTGLNISWRFSPGFPDSDKKDRVKGAFADWNGLDEEMRFEHLSEADVSYDFDCDWTQPYNGIFYNPEDGPGGTLARTLRCSHPDSPFNTLHHFSIKFDEAENWHGGSGEGGPNEHDFGGAAHHEAGHATGFDQHWPEGSDVCSSPRHTMCVKPSGNPVPFSYRSLEHHDKETFRNVYPPCSNGCAGDE